jgi:hypothetical protein
VRYLRYSRVPSCCSLERSHFPGETPCASQRIVCVNSSSGYIATDIIPFSTLIKRDHERYNSNQTARFRPSYIVANISASSLNPIYSDSELDMLPSHLRHRDHPPSLPAQQPYTSSSRPSHLLEAICRSRRYSCLLVWPTASTDCFNSFRKILPLAVFGIESTNRNSQ